MRYLLMVLLMVVGVVSAVSMSGCAQSPEYIDYRAAVGMTDGTILRNKEGCAFSVKRYDPYSVNLRFVAELSADTCTLTDYDAS